jgi:hypothetical protein
VDRRALDQEKKKRLDFLIDGCWSRVLGADRSGFRVKPGMTKLFGFPGRARNDKASGFRVEPAMTKLSSGMLVEPG